MNRISPSGPGGSGLIINRIKQEYQQFTIQLKVEVVGVFRRVGYPLFKPGISRCRDLVFVFYQKNRQICQLSRIS